MFHQNTHVVMTSWMAREKPDNANISVCHKRTSPTHRTRRGFQSPIFYSNFDHSCSINKSCIHAWGERDQLQRISILTDQDWFLAGVCASGALVHPISTQIECPCKETEGTSCFLSQQTCTLLNFSLRSVNTHRHILNVYVQGSVICASLSQHQQHNQLDN